MGQGMQVRRVAAKGSNGLGRPSRRDGYVVHGRSDVDGRRVEVDLLELCRKRRSLSFAFRSGWHVFAR